MAADAPINPPEAASPKPKRKWLYGSIALNLLLAGIMVGHVVSGPRHPHFAKHGPPPMAMRDVGFAFMRALPEERRKEVSKKIKSEFGGVKLLFEDSISARKEAFSLLEKEDVTQDQLIAAFAKVQSIDAQVTNRSAAFFAKVVVDIPVDERRAAVAEMRKRWAARENMRMRWKGDDGDRRGSPGEGPPMGMGMGGPGEGPPQKGDMLFLGEGLPSPPSE